ncbi:MAG: SRPBCC family protein [Acidimicrobiales bacterium]|nr:SRPBCC family protein [Acidimicrobiales bacterium]
MATYVTQQIDFVDTAPLMVEASNIVSATPREVWAAIVDYPRWVEWFPRVDACEPTSEPPTGVGSTRDVTLKGGLGVIAEKFIVWDELSCWAFTVTSGPPVFSSIVERITIEPVDDHRTRVTYRMALAPKWFVAPVLKAAKGQLHKVLATALTNLDGELEIRRREGD